MRSNRSNMTDDEKLNKLETEYKSYRKILVALSGGVDSCLAAFLGRKFLGKENTIAIISNSASLKEKDFKIASDFCKTHDIVYEVIYTNEMENPDYLSNPENRCYFCKNELYDEMNALVKSKYLEFQIINGNNYSDLGDYRPGLNAAAEQNARSPFISCKVNKAEIRALAKEFNLSVWDKPASPCLSSRFPYGEEISIEKLKRVEEAEYILNQYGYDEVRVRSYGNLAKIEVPDHQVASLTEVFAEVSKKIKDLGFDLCEIDAEGFISGKMNRVLK